MEHLKIIKNYPEDTSVIVHVVPDINYRINAVLKDTTNTIRIASIGLTYKAFASFNDALTFENNNEVQVMLYKFFQFNPHLVLENKMSVNLKKYPKLNDFDINLGNMCTFSMQKFFKNLSIDCDLHADALASSISTTNFDDNTILVQSIVSTNETKRISPECDLSLLNSILSTNQIKNCGEIYNNVSVGSTLNCSQEKVINVANNDIQIGCVVSGVVSYFKKLSDIDSLTFGEIDAWTMDMLDFTEGV